MNAVKSKSAWVALLAAGGLYAWKNRDKIQSWLNTQRDQLEQLSRAAACPPPARHAGLIAGCPPPGDPRGIYNNE